MKSDNLIHLINELIQFLFNRVEKISESQLVEPSEREAFKLYFIAELKSCKLTKKCSGINFVVPIVKPYLAFIASVSTQCGHLSAFL